MHSKNLQFTFIYIVCLGNFFTQSGSQFCPIFTIQPHYIIKKNLNRSIHNLTLKRYYSIQSSKTTSKSPDLSLCDTEILTDFDPIGQRLLEELYISNENEVLALFPQHSSTSRPVQHTQFKPKSVFNPVHAKGPYLQTFFKVVY